MQERIDAVEARVAPYLGAEPTAQYVGEYRNGNGAVGTPEQIIEKLRAVGDLGMGYAIHNFPGAAYDRYGIELFEREVIPALGG